LRRLEERLRFFAWKRKGERCPPRLQKKDHPLRPKEDCLSCREEVRTPEGKDPTANENTGRQKNLVISKRGKRCSIRQETESLFLKREKKEDSQVCSFPKKKALHFFTSKKKIFPYGEKE